MPIPLPQGRANIEHPMLMRMWRELGLVASLARTDVGSIIIQYSGPGPLSALRGGSKVRGASLQGGKMRGTVRGINARHWVICEAGMCEVQRTTGTAGVVIGCEPLKHN